MKRFKNKSALPMLASACPGGHIDVRCGLHVQLTLMYLYPNVWLLILSGLQTLMLLPSSTKDTSPTTWYILNVASGLVIQLICGQGVIQDMQRLIVHTCRFSVQVCTCLKAGLICFGPSVLKTKLEHDIIKTIKYNFSLVWPHTNYTVLWFTCEGDLATLAAFLVHCSFPTQQCDLCVR